MPKCPKCGAEIDYLDVWSLEWALQHYSLVNGEPDWSETRDWGSCERTEFQCPKCNAVLFLDEDEAKRFLSGLIEDEQSNKDSR